MTALEYMTKMLDRNAHEADWWNGTALEETAYSPEYCAEMHKEAAEKAKYYAEAVKAIKMMEASNNGC